MAKTIDGLPVVSNETFTKVVVNYPIASRDNDPEIAKKIKEENPQIDRIITLGMDNAPSDEAKSYYESGCQIVYELLRKQGEVDSNL